MLTTIAQIVTAAHRYF